MNKEEEHGLYLFKTLGFNPAKGKFDTKGYAITGIPEAKEDSDLVIKKHLDNKVQPIEKDVKRISELQRHMSEDVVALTTELNGLKTSTTTMAKVETHIEPMIQTLSIVKNSMLKEVVYEVMVKKNSNGKFPTPLRLIDSVFHKHSLSSINIYNKIELLHIGTQIKFLNSKNNEIHHAKFKTRKNLKTPINIIIKKNKESSLESNNILYNYTANKTKTHKNISPVINLDNKFQDKIVIQPENMESCFINTSEEGKYKEVRPITPEVENIKLSILFLLRLTYNIGGKEVELPDDSEDYEYIDISPPSPPTIDVKPSPTVVVKKSSQGCPNGYVRVGSRCVLESTLDED